MQCIASSESNARQPQSTVYVVDDDRATRESLSWLIESVGVRVETFPSAASFLDAYKSQSPGCLVVDLVMPGMTGLELQQELRRRGDEIPVIVLTGYGTVPLAVDALKGGVIEFLQKPVDHNVLMKRIRHALAEDARRRPIRAEFRRIGELVGRLTRRQSEVLGLVVKGLSSKEIAANLQVNFKTVEAHRLAIMKTMEARGVADLVRMVVQNSGEP
jgi:two-component system response regulator FixJ